MYPTRTDKIDFTDPLRFELAWKSPKLVYRLARSRGPGCPGIPEVGLLFSAAEIHLGVFQRHPERSGRFSYGPGECYRDTGFQQLLEKAGQVLGCRDGLGTEILLAGKLVWEISMLIRIGGCR